jgi:hypothetical protein
VLQFAAVLLWFASIRPAGGPAGLCLDLSAISLLQWLAFLLLACYGQSLNVGIFQVNCRVVWVLGVRLFCRVLVAVAGVPAAGLLRAVTPRWHVPGELQGCLCVSCLYVLPGAAAVAGAPAAGLLQAPA